MSSPDLSDFLYFYLYIIYMNKIKKGELIKLYSSKVKYYVYDLS